MKYFQIIVNQLQAGFAGFLRQPRADAHDVGIGTVGILALSDDGGQRRVEYAVAQVAGFGSGTLGIDVNQHQFVARSLVNQGKRIADADGTRAHHHNFIAYF